MYIMIHIGDDLSSEQRDKLKQAIEDRLPTFDDYIGGELTELDGIDNSDNDVAWVESIALIDE